MFSNKFSVKKISLQMGGVKLLINRFSPENKKNPPGKEGLNIVN
jgi:hypothetical protein